MLKNLKVSELYTEGSYCDAQDTTNEFIMAKIIEVKNNEILVNYDGWSTKWNTVSFFLHISSLYLHPVFSFYMSFGKLITFYNIYSNSGSRRNRIRLHHLEQKPQDIQGKLSWLYDLIRAKILTQTNLKL